MESIGIVRAKNNNKIFVEFTRESACGESCESCSAKCAESESELFEFPNTLSADIGDVVKIKTRDKSILSYKFLVYGLPLILFMSTITISYYLMSKMFMKNIELISLIMGIISLIISYLIIKGIDHKFQKANKGDIFLEKM
ncbi:MAG: SoxR reducing system RseC family protein [Peptoniphilus sp.]|uniref:SoxR reducing system RseC family protein n=1 Tax=Peptoniphilus sp. TaxID=1971214 RepID=UPI0025E872FC|nr:SoxR reducing system RseC family protein [Peptoniphilus sp.]MCI5643616.1 SoxR reducing system RseC family protein [Peptoniphilus sp.]MDD7351932.1 SoxR reducing system RseC family protein [Peptoniphilaceae bacterium]